MRLIDSERGRDLGFEARSEGAPNSRSYVCAGSNEVGKMPAVVCVFVLIECRRYQGFEARR